MSYVSLHLQSKSKLIEDLRLNPNRINYYSKYGTFIGNTDSVQYIEKQIKNNKMSKDLKDLSNYRMSYEQAELLEKDVSDNPMQLFQKWFYEVDNSDANIETNAMTISSIGLDGYPKNRVVLLKRWDWDGFIFYTNYNSEKGKALEANPNICASFFWHTAERQVIIKGRVQKLAANLSDGYFESRPEGSKIGAWASPQSQVVPNRQYLIDRQAEFTKKFEGKEIPRPNHWGGYKIVPHSIEFWQGRKNRLHDRIRFTLDNKTWDWKVERLGS